MAPSEEGSTNAGQPSPPSETRQSILDLQSLALERALGSSDEGEVAAALSCTSCLSNSCSGGLPPGPPEM
jgi:hypothetical protein